ncbi:TPA: hypothetical protein LAF97_004970, partial [Escherichia coli]|nr:hypothetical protein [Escherichia coli]
LAGAQIVGQGRVFVVTADARAGGRVVLVRHSDRQPRTFSDAGTALKLLRDVGFATVTADMAAWRPEQAEISARRKKE